MGVMASRVYIATYYSLDVLVHVAGQYVVCGGIQLVQGARCNLQYSGEADARPVVLVRTKTLYRKFII